MRRSLRLVPVALAVAVIPVLPVQPVEAQWTPPSRDFDARIGYFGSQQTGREATGPRNDQLRARIRFGGSMPFGSSFSGKIRGAGRFGTAQEGLDLYLHDHPRQIDGLALGQLSLDELYLAWSPPGAWTVRAGRMQTKFELDGVAKKSLDRNDSPNTDVTWTDGIAVSHTTEGQWRADLILQHNPRHGPTNVIRPPLGFSAKGSRVTVFAGIGSSRPVGPIVQRGLGVTVVPRALPAGVDATGGATPGDYLGLTARTALAWPVLQGTRRFMLAGEVGWAPNTPAPEAPEGSPDEAPGSAAGGMAAQLSANLFDVLPGHHLGLVYGRTESGWLLSPDFRPDNHLVEGRYQWKPAGSHSMEARLRWRRALDTPSTGPGPSDLDAYLRFSLKF